MTLQTAPYEDSIIVNARPKLTFPLTLNIGFKVDYDKEKDNTFNQLNVDKYWR